MKRGLIIFTILMLFIGVTACGNAGPPSETGALPSDSNSQATTEAENTGTNAEQEEQNNSVQETSDSSQMPANNLDFETEAETEDTNMKMNVQIGDVSFTATLENNAAVSELVEMMREAPVSISMSDYSGFEKVGPLGRSLTTDNHQTTTSAGDIVLYSGNQIVIFYGSNSWSYTRIGRIDDLTGWEEALGNGGITAVFSLIEAQ